MADANAKAEIGEAEAYKNKRIETSVYNAAAVDGENRAAIDIANSIAARKEAEAEADRKIVVAQKTKSANALQESYKAEKIAEDARAERERSQKFADIVVPAQIDKEKIQVDAEAEAEKIRRIEKGKADGIFFKMDAQARGTYEQMIKQAEGFKAYVEAAGGDPDKAISMMIADKLPEIIRTQVEAIKGVKFDNITVWDTGNGGGSGSSTSNWLTNLLKSVPPMNDAFKMVGQNIPGFLEGDADMVKLLEEKSKVKKSESEKK